MVPRISEGFFDLVPNEVLIETVRPLSVGDLVAVTSTSMAFRQRIAPLIGAESDLISRICSEVITYQDQEALPKVLAFYAEWVNNRTLSLHLTIDLDTLWHGTENALAEIAKLFQSLDTITFTHPHEGKLNESLCPVLPSGIKKLVIEKVDMLPLSKMCLKLDKLVELRCIFSKSTYDLEKEIFRIPYPSSFEYFDVEYSQISESFGNCALDGHKNAVKSFGIACKLLLGVGDQEQAIFCLQESVRQAPNFLQARVLLARLEKSEENDRAMNEALKKKRADTSLTQFELAMTSNCFERAIELAIEKKSIGILIQIAKELQSKELADRAYQLIDRRHLSREAVTAYLYEITTIDPTHIEAVSDLFYLFQSKYATNCLKELQTLYWGKNFFVDFVVMLSGVPRENQRKSSFSEEEEEIILRTDLDKTSWRAAVCDCFLKNNRPIDSIIRYWVNCCQTAENYVALYDIYAYLNKNDLLFNVQKELAETLIVNLRSYHNLRYELLHNILSNEEDISESKLSYRLSDFLKQKWKKPTREELSTLLSLFEKKNFFSRLKLRLIKYIEELDTEETRLILSNLTLDQQNKR